MSVCVTAPEAAADRDGVARDVSRKIKTRALRRRRSKIIRPIAFYGVVTLGMLVVSILHRDSQAHRTGMEVAGTIAAKLQDEFDRTHRSPRGLPELKDYPALPELYYFNIFYADSMSGYGESGVCALRRPLRRLLQPEGRFLIVFDGRSYRAQWLEESEFRERATGLGLGAVLNP